MQPINFTDDYITKLLGELSVALTRDRKVSNQTFTFTKALRVTKRDAIEIRFTEEAYDKMMSLVYHFSTEIGWHGLVNRIDDTHFEIYDILVYPQTVSGATVNTDQKKYEMWLMDPDIHSDEDISHMRMQGHSHVNMSTSPSSVDLSNQDRFLGVLGKDDYYIFLIWNKREECSARVYDMKNNVMYDESDISFVFGDRDYDDFCKEAEAMLEKPAPPVQYQFKYSGYGYTADNPGSGYQIAQKSDTKSEQKTATKTVTGAASPKIQPMMSGNALYDYYSDNDDEIGMYGNSSCYLYSGYNQT